MAETDRYTAPGSTIRTVLEMHDSDYALLVTDRGAVAKTAGVTFTLPPYYQPFLGESCFIVNVSSGDITVVTASGEVLRTVDGEITTVTIPPGASRSFLRETTGMKWVGTGAPQTIDQALLQTLINAAVDDKVSNQTVVAVKGDRGDVGPAGADGKSAYQLAVDNGFSGSVYDWLMSLRGPAGEDGNDGADGSDGADGQTPSVATLQGYAANAAAAYASEHPGFSGVYGDLTGKPTLFSGSYADLTNKPSIPAAQVQSDWNATTGLGAILNKPTLFSGAYSDLSGKPSLFSGAYSDLTGKPSLFDGTWSSLTGKPTFATVATTGSYTDLTNRPTIPAAQVQTDWNAVSGIGVLLNKPTLFSGAYTDLTGKPSLFSGAYTDLTGKPTIPSAQIQSDWTQASTGSLDYIKNKPTLGTAAAQASTAFATSAQGIKADSALQTASLPLVVTGTALSINAASGSAAGAMSAADYTKLSGVATGATATPLGSATPQPLGTAGAGSSTNASREDHVHLKPTGLNTLLANVTIGQTATVAIALGIREVTVACTGAVAGGRYTGFVRTYSLNGAAAVAGRPTGYALLDTVSNSANNITVALNAPLLAIGSSYSFSVDVVAVGV